MKMNLYINKAQQDAGATSHLYKQAMATFASCLISMCAGITLGITSVMLPQLREDKTIEYNPSADSWIASIATLAMIFGCLSSGSILDSYGRRIAHIVLGVPIIVGWIIIACANSTTVILVGRFITGLSTGPNKAVSLVYIGEIADPKIRAAALFLPGLMTHIGILFSHVVGYYVPWKVSAMISIVPAVISSVTFLFLKESPLWLIAKGRTEQGIETFRWFRGTDEASELELKSVLERQLEKPKMTVKETLNAICTKAFIKPMLILTVLMISVQCSGVNVIIFYSMDIFKSSFSGNLDPFIMMIVMDCSRVSVSFLIFLLGKFVPRKIAFTVSSFGCTVFVFCLTTCLALDFDSYLWVLASCLVLYICFSSAIVTIGWSFVPEILPNHARGFGSGLNSAVTYLSLFVLVNFTPDFINVFGDSALFGFFGVSALISGLFMFFILPETNGKTLQAIEDTLFERK